jgi:hypothetical protein
MRRTWDRLGPVSGILFVVLMVVATIISGNLDVDPEDPGAALARELVESSDEQDASSTLSMLGLFFFIWFAAHLRDRLRRAGDAAEWIVSVFWAGALLFGAGFLINGLSQASLSAVEDYGTDVAAAKALVAIWWDSTILAGPGMAALGAAAAIVILKFGVLPRWLGGLAVLVFLGGFMPWIGIAVLALWVLAVSIALLIERQPATAG